MYCMLSNEKVVSTLGKKQGLLTAYISRGLDMGIYRLGCLSTTLSVDVAMRLFSGVAFDSRWEEPLSLIVTAWNAIRDHKALHQYLALHIDVSDCDEFFEFCKRHEKDYFPMRLRYVACVPKITIPMMTATDTFLVSPSPVWRQTSSLPFVRPSLTILTLASPTV